MTENVHHAYPPTPPSYVALCKAVLTLEEAIYKEEEDVAAPAIVDARSGSSRNPTRKKAKDTSSTRVVDLVRWSFPLTATMLTLFSPQWVLPITGQSVQ